MITDRIIIMAAALAVMAQGAAAQTAQRMSLDDCMRTALENNTSLRSGRIAVERARDLQASAYDFAKTDVSLGQDLTSGGSAENAITVSQTFEFPTVYGARRSVRKAETQLEEIRLEMTRNELEREVSAAYYGLLYAMERRRILGEQDSLYARFLFLAEARLNAGESGRLEQINADRLLRENRVALSGADREIEAARLRLRLWMNTEENVAPADVSLAAIPADSAFATLFDAGTSPSARLSRQQQTVAERNLRLVRQAFLPDISLGASTQMVLTGLNPYDVDRSRFEKGNFMGFEIGLSVPLLFGAKRAEVKAAKKAVEMARLQDDGNRRKIESDYKIACNAFRQAREALDYYRSEGCAQAGEIERLSQVSYEKGDIDYIEYIQNLQTALEMRMSHAAALNDYNQAVIALRYFQ